ncbi:MAG: hypothetical protein KDJ97_36620, partial [Anaerolineae bacterium]|nr:hypothetical protein [Anaerolineae bacterium]
VAAKENLLKQVIGFPLNVFSTRFFYQAANSFADIKIPNRLLLSMAPPFAQQGAETRLWQALKNQVTIT